jgi:hypothetical protein
MHALWHPRNNDGIPSVATISPTFLVHSESFMRFQVLEEFSNSFIHTPKTSRIMLGISCTGTRLANRAIVAGTVPGWWRSGTLLGDEPPSPGLDGDHG